MKQLLHNTIAVLALMLFWCGTIPDTETPSNTDQSTQYTFAVVPQFHSQTLFKIWSPILKKLSAETGIKFKLTGASSFPAFENELKAGRYQFAYVNPYHAVLANKTRRYEAILSDKEHKVEGILVMKKETNMAINSLRGPQVAFPSPNTLASSILMRSELKSKYKLDITPKYLRTHADVYMGVYQGEYKAGSGVVRTFNKLNPKIKDKLKIVHRTEKIPAHPIVVHPSIPAGVRAKVVAAFEKMSKDAASKALLQKIPAKNMQKTSQSVYNKITFNTSL